MVKSFNDIYKNLQLYIALSLQVLMTFILYIFRLFLVIAVPNTKQAQIYEENDNNKKLWWKHQIVGRILDAYYRSQKEDVFIRNFLWGWNSSNTNSISAVHINKPVYLCDMNAMVS